ncbi:lysR-family transcriptional regulator domain protein [Bordetella holmesii 41130]|nr:lysR-family transcriptional regulator domain protein [Bordetella holmesii ATCC 51541]EWM44152.1 lysR-family transcriptional regulator domain protein [Bordetella holmesii 41130]
MGPQGVWRTLYAAVRDEDRDASYIDEFLTIARDISFKTLSGIKGTKQ